MNLLSDPLRVGIRAQDVQTSTQDVSLGALGADIKNIRLLGMTERLAAHIRGANVIDDYQRLQYMATELGIDPLALPTVLELLEDMTWVRVEKSGLSIKRVDETVPIFSDIYKECGKYFRENGILTEVELTTLTTCDALAVVPATEESMIKRYGFDREAFRTAVDVGRSGKLIADYKSQTGESVMYSPLYWVENPGSVESIFILLRKYGAEEVEEALRSLRDAQGQPIGDALQADPTTLDLHQRIIREAVQCGLLLAPEVVSMKGPQRFAFVPQVGVPLEERLVLEKAMAVLSCIRYGEHFGTITKIIYPELILERLLKEPHQIGPHTEIAQQYAILVTRGMGQLLRDKNHTNRCFFKLLPTDENLKAIRLAMDLLRVGEALETKAISANAQSVLFMPGNYREAMRTPARLKADPVISRESAARHLNQHVRDLFDNLRGA